MPKKPFTAIEKIEKNLFLPAGEKPMALTVDEQKVFDRYQDVYVYWHSKPDLRDSQIITYIKNRHKITKSQAYRDLSNIKYLLGNVAVCQKEWLRYTVFNMCKEAFAMAKAAKNPIAMALAADKMGKYGKLDHESGEGINWDDFKTSDFEPTSDITVLDKRLSDPDFEKKRQALRKKLSGDYVDFVEVVTKNKGNGE